MLDHVAVQVTDLGRAAEFYDVVLAALGGTRLFERPDAIGYGVGFPSFWIGRATDTGPDRPVHLAFQAPDRAAVVAFFQAAVGAGATVLHEPRVWSEYHPGYYGAFVRDPDGNNIEAVCHRPG